jgi:hypothetical protein
VKIDLERVEAIKQIGQPRNKKEVQYCLGKIGFLKRFVPDFVEMVKHVTNMLKKDHEVKWTAGSKESFQWIKESLGESLVLINPNCDKDFLIFSFTSTYTLVVVLLLKKKKTKRNP